MKQTTYTIRDAYGIHARPAGQLSKLAKGYPCTVTLTRGEASCDLKHLIALMGLGVKQGDTVTVKADGEGEDGCIEAVAAFLAANV